MSAVTLPPLISLVIPVYNEAGALSKNIPVIAAALDGLGLRREIVLVDDGSSDATWNEILRIQSLDSTVRGLRLSRNFGKEAAICAGLDHVTGDACIVMDSDLQHPPSALPEMIRLWREEGFPIVDAVKRSRGRERLLNRWGARAFYGMLRRLSALDLRQASDFKLLDARIVAAWRLLRERETFFRGLTAWMGFPRGKVYFDVPLRALGKSQWSRLRLIRLAIMAILSFSAMPMQVVTTLGIVFMLGAIPLGIQTLYNKFFGGAETGFTTVITLLLIVGSVLMISLGVIGSYIARIFEEVKQRPRYLLSARAEESDRREPQS